MDKLERLRRRLEKDLKSPRAKLWGVRLLCDPPKPTAEAALLVAQELQLYTSVFPKCVGALVSLSDDDAARAVLVENLWEEHGCGDLTRSHRALYEQFYESLKRHSPDINLPILMLDSTTEAAQSLLDVATSGFLRGLGALAVGVEDDTAAQFRAIHSYFSNLPQGHALNCEFFTLHEASDDAHAEAMLGILAAYVTDDETYSLALEGASCAIAADLKFWSGVDAAIGKYGAQIT